MTLEEAIKHAEEVAKSCQLKAYDIERDDYKDLEECATEHRQLVEWLRELKRLREQELCEDVVSRAEAIRICKERGHDNSAYYIEQLPSVTPKRCKDCQYSYVFEPWEGDEALRYCKILRSCWSRDSDLCVDDDDYCSRGVMIDG